MPKYFTKNWQSLLVSVMLSISIAITSSSIVFAVTGDAPPPAADGGSSSSSSSGGVVVQPPIIPDGAIPPGSKLYLPHDSSNVGNKSFIQNSLLPGIASTIIGITGGLALLFVVISGIQYLTSYGDPTTADKAKKTLTFALIGVILAGLSYAIVAIISTINVQ